MRAIIYHPVDKEYLVPNSEKNKLAMELADLFWEENNRQIPISIQVGGSIANDVSYVFCLEFDKNIVDYELLNRDFVLYYIRISQSYEDSPEYVKN